jgi:CubicO group peptidase (beta-lactamase class C family)
MGLAVIVWVLSIIACGGSGPADSSRSVTQIEDEVRSELSDLTDGSGDPTRALAGLAVAVLREGEVSFEAAFGRASIDPAGINDRALTPENLMRVASISKTLSAIVVMQLVEKGELELDSEVSEYLGWELRNPNFPDRAITLRYLLAHISSIRDAGESYIIRYPRALQEAFDPADPDFDERFQINEEGTDRGPGAFFEYANLNYGVVATVLEKVTGVRFDELMRQRFFAPLGLPGGFNVAALSEPEQENLATLYRKRDREEIWHPEGDWVAQVDDLSGGIPTALPDDANYLPGTNGAQFSPQGGARMSLRGLETLAKLFLGDGSVGDARVLAPESMAELRRPVWRYDPEKKNLEDYTGRLNAYAPGLRVITSETAGDRLFAGDDRSWIGHFGEAYGLLAGVWVHPESGDCVIFAITGSAFDPHAEDDGTNTLAPIEAEILEQLGKLL